ncbi:MAG: rRNA adenine dimethyltransferase family protein [Xanthomonadales bacterium]|nr:rRNA adenine dimethyltransferase family protein [Xanthomonadales bacterium]
MRAAGLGTLRLIHGNALAADFAALAGGHPLRVVGNLPYYLSTPILFRVLDQIEAVADMHFMLQRELVERMAASPGSRRFGRLSVAVQSLCRVEPLFHVDPGCFRPPPRVESTVVRLRPLPPAERPAADRRGLDLLLRRAFARRRKTLANALADLVPRERLPALGIDPALRPEALDVPSWCRLSLALHGSATERGL